MTRDMAANEVGMFFRISFELRALIRLPRPSLRELRFCFEEVAAIAMHTEQPKLAARCRNILEEFAQRFSCAKKALTHLDYITALHR